MKFTIIKLGGIFRKNKNKITFQYDSSHQNNSYQKYLTTLLIHAQIQVLGFKQPNNFIFLKAEM